MEKKYTNIRGRLDQLRKRGMDIPKDKEKERSVIKKYNYYNLINGYKTPFLEDRNNYPAGANTDEDFYQRGIKPSHLESLYSFDEKLREIFLERILKIEEKLKDVLVQSFYKVHTNNGTNKLVDILHRESEYLRRNYYNLDSTDTYVVLEKSGFKYTEIGKEPLFNEDVMRRKPKKYTIHRDDTYDSFIAKVYSTIGQQRKKNKSINAYLNKHTYLPMWILTNILTFGNISRLFEIQRLDVQLQILQHFKINTLTDEVRVLNMSRIIHILGIYRNLCAHNERFYCETIHIPLDDEFMEYYKKIPTYLTVNGLKGGTRYIRKGNFEKLERYRHGLYTLMFAISLFLNKSELTKFKNDIRKELKLLKSSIPERPYRKVEKLMGIDFDWYSSLIK